LIGLGRSGTLVSVANDGVLVDQFLAEAREAVRED
jgi:hypothetical protein